MTRSHLKSQEIEQWKIYWKACHSPLEALLAVEEADCTKKAREF